MECQLGPAALEVKVRNILSNWLRRLKENHSQQQAATQFLDNVKSQVGPSLKSRGNRGSTYIGKALSRELLAKSLCQPQMLNNWPWNFRFQTLSYLEKARVGVYDRKVADAHRMFSPLQNF